MAIKKISEMIIRLGVIPQETLDNGLLDVLLTLEAVEVVVLTCCLFAQLFR